MKKTSHSKKSPPKKKKPAKGDSGELRKPNKLKPLKGKENKNWKNSLQEEEEEGDFEMLPEEEDIKFDDLNAMPDEEEEDDGYFDDNF